MRSAPVIGLTAYCEHARWSHWHAPAVLLPANYAEQVAAAGGIPVLLPPLPGIAAAVDRVDGLLLTGGGDIDPGRYGARAASAHLPGERAARRGRAGAARRGRGAPGSRCSASAGACNCSTWPVAGRCASTCPSEAGHTPEPGTFGSHPVRVAAGTRLAGILGANGSAGRRADRASSVHRPRSATAWSPPRGPRTGSSRRWNAAATAIRSCSRVQWHPEAGTDRRLIEALVAAPAAR